MAKKKSKPKHNKAKTKSKKTFKPVALQPIRVPSLKPTTRPQMSSEEIKKIEDDLRDLMNWIAVFEKEYDLPREVVDTLHNKIHNLAQRIGWLRCS